MTVRASLMPAPSSAASRSSAGASVESRGRCPSRGRPRECRRTSRYRRRGRDDAPLQRPPAPRCRTTEYRPWRRAGPSAAPCPTSSRNGRSGAASSRCRRARSARRGMPHGNAAHRRSPSGRGGARLRRRACSCRCGVLRSAVYRLIMESMLPPVTPKNRFRAAQRRERVGALPVRLGDDADAEAVCFEQAADDRPCRSSGGRRTRRR